MTFDVEILLKILSGLVVTLCGLLAFFVRGTWVIANLLRDLKGELQMIRGDLSRGEAEFAAIRREFWPRTSMERFASYLKQDNPDLRVPDPHGSEFRD